MVQLPSAARVVQGNCWANGIEEPPPVLGLRDPEICRCRSSPSRSPFGHMPAIRSLMLGLPESPRMVANLRLQIMLPPGPPTHSALFVAGEVPGLSVGNKATEADLKL